MDRNRRLGVFDEELLPRRMVLPQHHIHGNRQITIAPLKPQIVAWNIT
jgi:hypothetical protein